MKIPYSPPDYFLVDELLSDEQKIIPSAIRNWVDRRFPDHAPHDEP